MTNQMPNARPADAQLAQLERAVDVGNMSYADAREQLGMPPADNSMFTVGRIKARLDAHSSNVELYHVPATPGLPDPSPEARASIRESQKQARAAVVLARLTFK